jgi:hypothetical protein
MRRQRPVLANVGAVACLGVLAAGLAGCGAGKVTVDSPALHGADASACRALVNALPDTVSDQPRRPVDPPDAFAAAWGDPAIVLRCGVPKPAGFDEFSTCQVTNGVGWFIPENQITGAPEDIVMTTVGRAQNVEVRIPSAYWPPAATMVDLTKAITSTIREVKPCL